jgi:hypothetical protein
MSVPDKQEAQLAGIRLTGNYSIRGHKSVYRYLCGETSYKRTSG